MFDTNPNRMKMRMLLIPVALVSVALPARADASPYERTDAMVAMSDGVRLSASVYVPASAAADAALPLLVRQHGGGSHKDNVYDVSYGLKYVDEGFALLLYSHRGHGESEGSFDFFGSRTTKDFSEMLDWVEATFGATIDTERVGVSGYSQGGGESLLPAAHDDRVKAAAVGQTFADLNHALNPNDCFKMSWATGIFAAAYKVSMSETDDATAVRWGATWYTGTEDVAGTTAEAFAHSPAAYIDRLDVPVFWAQAWEDQLFPGDHPERILEPLRARGVPVHYWFSSGGHARGPNFPAEEIARERAMLEWIDENVRGVDHGFATRPITDYWIRTAPGSPGTWEPRTADAFPIPAQPSVLHARADGALSPIPAAGSVGTIVNPGVTANVAYDDILNEVARNIPGMGDVVGGVPEDAVAGPHRVSFTSAPFATATEITGAPVVRATFETTSRTAVQLNAKLWDVSDAGATLVWRGCTSVEDLSSGSVVLPLWPNAHVVGAGHRLQLGISSVDAPMFKPDVEPAATTLTTASIELPVR